MAAPSKQFLALAALLGATAAATLISFTSSNEGVSLTPYRDVTGKYTVCYGQTGVPMRVYTEDECTTLLVSTMLLVAQHVRDMTPGFDLLPDGPKVATNDFAYNVGLGAYDRSSLRSKLARGQLTQACRVFRLYKFAGGMDCSKAMSGCPGVWTRRLREERMCITGK